MKDISSLLEQLSFETENFGIELSSDEKELLIKHFLLVKEKNKCINLTRITNDSDGVSLHIVDSLLYKKVLDSYLKKTEPSENSDIKLLLDIGSGAGYPGIPLAITTDYQVTLLDSVKKKVVVLNEFISELKLSQTSTSDERVEALAQNKKHGFEIITARAVAQLEVLIEYAAPLLKKNGIAVFSKGKLSKEELECAEKAASICGLKNVSRETFELAENKGTRTLLVYKKVSEPRIKLPRRIGLAKQEPLSALKKYTNKS